MRGSGPGGRFDARYEVESNYEGMTDELYDPVGMVLAWMVFDPTHTVVDSIYDIGDPDSGGRKWSGPHRVPVLGVRFTQGETMQNMRGLYTSDVLHVVINVAQMEKVFNDILGNTDAHLRDRFLYRGEIWEPTRIWQRGAVGSFYHVISVDALQVKGDQVVNDVQFLAYADPGSVDPSAFHGTGYRYRGVYDSGTTYYDNDVVLVNGQLWVVVDDSNGAGVIGVFP